MILCLRGYGSTYDDVPNSDGTAQSGAHRILPPSMEPGLPAAPSKMSANAIDVAYVCAATWC